MAWGAYHGLLLMAYRRFGSYWDSLPSLIQRGGMFFLVIIGWSLFRAPNFTSAAILLNRMFIPQEGAALVGTAVLLVVLMVAGSLARIGPRSFEISHRWKPAAAFGLGLLLLLSIARIYSSEPSPFLYFQF